MLKYEPGQKYLEHWDWFEEEERKKMDMDETNRIATILVYLTGAASCIPVSMLRLQAASFVLHTQP